MFTKRYITSDVLERIEIGEKLDSRIETDLYLAIINSIAIGIYTIASIASYVTGGPLWLTRAFCSITAFSIGIFIFQLIQLARLKRIRNKYF